MSITIRTNVKNMTLYGKAQIKAYSQVEQMQECNETQCISVIENGNYMLL